MAPATRCRSLAAEVESCRRAPTGRLARGGGARPSPPLPGRALLGAAAARLRRSAGEARGRRARPGGARRQPHRAVFTGDRSGDWLFAALHRAGFANQPTSVARDDGLGSSDAYVTAVVRCAPPGNKPAARERDNCLPYLGARACALLRRARVLLALGAFAWDGALLALREARHRDSAAEAARSATVRRRSRAYVLLGCFHPSQQNTFTGRLTEEMTDAVLARVSQPSGAA